MYNLLINHSFAVYFIVGLFIIIIDFIMDYNENIKKLNDIIPSINVLIYGALVLFSLVLAALIWPHTIYRWVTGKSLLGGEVE